MRTTITLAPDVDSAVRRFQKARGLKPKDAINLLLREGLATVATAPRKPHKLPPAHKSGRSLVGSLDNISEVLSLAEGERHR